MRSLSLEFPLRRAMCAVFVAVSASIAPATTLMGQSSAAPDTTNYNYCLGFAFGSWNPSLDLKAAGHNPAVDTSHFTRAPGGRDWAASGGSAPGDSTIMLFPIWWPAGVVIALEHIPMSAADTVRGKATALVADGRKSSPTSNIRAWQKRCG